MYNYQQKPRDAEDNIKLLFTFYNKKDGNNSFGLWENKNNNITLNDCQRVRHFGR